MIKFATKNDIADIMDFIENHWKHGHILARDRNFFEYLILQIMTELILRYQKIMKIKLTV